MKRRRRSGRRHENQGAKGGVSVGRPTSGFGNILRDALERARLRQLSSPPNPSEGTESHRAAATPGGGWKKTPPRIDSQPIRAAARIRMKAPPQFTPERKNGSLTTGPSSKPGRLARVTQSQESRTRSSSNLTITARPTAAAPAAPSKDAWTLIQARLSALPIVSETRARREAASCKASETELRALADRLAGVAASTRNHGRKIEVVLGVDFGTSSTKVVARLPYEAGSPAFAVPVPPFARAESHPYLWASRLWVTSAGDFSLWPAPNARAFCAIKTRLILGSNGVEAASSEADDLDPELVAAAFLALQLRQARGWIARELSAVLAQGEVVWSYNFGFPAASLNDPGLSDRYRRCVAAAVFVATDKVEVSIRAVRDALSVVALSPTEAIREVGAELVPEIAAAVAGFANSTRLDDGLYALVDVGGSTVDCCTFNLFKTGDGSARCPIFAADVAMLGVEPWLVCEDDAVLAKHFRDELDRRQHSVIWQTKRDWYPASDRWTTGLPVFFVGGGVQSAVHRDSISSLNAWLRRHNGRGGGTRILRLPVPENLDHSLCEPQQVHRLAVAIGLSLPTFEIPEIKLPQAIEHAPALPRRPLEENYIDKDHV